jgi:hydrogenase-4 component A
MPGGKTMNRFVIAEPKRCIGCNTCMAACMSAHKAQGQQSYPRLTLTTTLRGSAPVLCRHCEDAMCARVCPVHAITHQDGAVVLDEKTCIGCKMCALACPFGAITPSGTSTAGVAGIKTITPTHPKMMNPILVWEIGVRSVAVKCDLCAFDPEGPACIKACPTKALIVVDQAELRRANKQKQKIAAWQATGMPMTKIEERE